MKYVRLFVLIVSGFYVTSIMSQTVKNCPVFPDANDNFTCAGPLINNPSTGSTQQYKTFAGGDTVNHALPLIQFMAQQGILSQGFNHITSYPNLGNGSRLDDFSYSYNGAGLNAIHMVTTNISSGISTDYVLNISNLGASLGTVPSISYAVSGSYAGSGVLNAQYVSPQSDYSSPPGFNSSDANKQIVGNFDFYSWHEFEDLGSISFNLPFYNTPYFTFVVSNLASGQNIMLQLQNLSAEIPGLWRVRVSFNPYLSYL